MPFVTNLPLALSTKCPARRAARAAAVKAASTLHAVPLSLRNAPHLVIGKAALSETVTSRVTDREGKEMTNAEHLQYSAMKAGLESWKARGWAPTMRLELTAEEMKQLKMKDDSGSVTGDIVSKMLELTGGVRPSPQTAPYQPVARRARGPLSKRAGIITMAQPQDALDHIVEAADNQVTTATVCQPSGRYDSYCHS
jgi:hypothetical protein